MSGSVGTATLQWNGNGVLAEVKGVIEEAVQDAVLRIAAKARALCPVGKVEKGPRQTFFYRPRPRKGRAPAARQRRVDRSGTPWTARKPGTLRDSIRTKVVWWKGICLGFVKAGYDRKRGEGDPNAFYATFVELGTKKMRPKPYLRPALRAVNVQAILDAKASRLR